jgi:hypothetical protein
VCRICKGGELFDEIIARGKFTEKDAAVLMKDKKPRCPICREGIESIRKVYM